MKKAIRHNWFYNAPPEIVWKFLTTPELLAQWLMPNDIKPLKGHSFMFKTKPYPQMSFDGNIYCEILEAIPFEKLIYSWKGGPGEGIFTLDSVVTWTLIKEKTGTKLFLDHDGFDTTGNQFGFESMNAGWKGMLEGKLGDLIAKKWADETAS
jgi:uncharacterized protein YndB with AHSA1/START domain